MQAHGIHHRDTAMISASEKSFGMRNGLRKKTFTFSRTIKFTRRSLCLCGEFSASSRRGFTLMEMLVALLISTLVMAAAASVFVTTTQGWERGRKAARLNQTAQSTSNLLERYIRAAVPANTDGRDVMVGESLDSESGSYHLLFVTSAQNRLMPGRQASDCSVVDFSFDPARGNTLFMRINPSSDNIFLEGGYELPVAEGVLMFSARFFDGTEWLDEWYEPGLPLAIEFSFVLDEQKLSGRMDTGEIVEEDELSESASSVDSDSLRSAGGLMDAEGGAEGIIPGYYVSRLITLPLGGKPQSSNP